MTAITEELTDVPEQYDPRLDGPHLLGVVKLLDVEDAYSVLPDSKINEANYRRSSAGTHIGFTGLDREGMPLIGVVTTEIGPAKKVDNVVIVGAMDEEDAERLRSRQREIDYFRERYDTDLDRKPLVGKLVRALGIQSFYTSRSEGEMRRAQTGISMPRDAEDINNRLDALGIKDREVVKYRPGPGESNMFSTRRLSEAMAAKQFLLADDTDAGAHDRIIHYLPFVLQSPELLEYIANMTKRTLEYQDSKRPIEDKPRISPYIVYEAVLPTVAGDLMRGYFDFDHERSGGQRYKELLTSQLKCTPEEAERLYVAQAAWKKTLLERAASL